MKKYISELLGTFFLVVAGAGSIRMGFPHFWIAVSFGLVVTLMILWFGKWSGAHINPAVSVGFALLKKEPKLLLYIPYQLTGALLGSCLVAVALPHAATHGETLPSAGVFNTFVIEVGISGLLMATILLITKQQNAIITAVVIGFYVFLAAYYAGPYTGASMNPARSFGPAIFSKTVHLLWIYTFAPTLGVLLPVLVKKRLRLES